MRKIIVILFLLNGLLLQGRDPEFIAGKESSLTFISPYESALSLRLDYSEKPFTLASLLYEAHHRMYQKERYFIQSRFSGRIRPLLKATSMKLSYKYVVLAVPLNHESGIKRNLWLKTSPFVSVLLNRKSIYSDTYAFDGHLDKAPVQSLHDLGVSIGAGVRLPVTARLKIDVGVRDELGLLNLDGFILGKYSFSQNNSIGVILGLSYTI
jgi:hypothetical protein